jgi:L-malate glycosyltransferase
MKKKVLIIQQILPEYRVAFFALLKTELEKCSISLELIYGDGNLDSDTNNDPALPWAMRIANRSIGIGKLKLNWQPLIKYLGDKDLIIVEKANKLLLNYYIIVARKFWKNRLGFWGHGRNLQADAQSPGNRINRLFLKKCDWWWAYTNSVKDFLVQHRYPPSRITVVQNSIDTHALRMQLAEVNESEINSLKKQLGITSIHTAIFCGRMYTEKRLNFILETCYLVKSKIPEFHMIFIGSGPDSELVKKASASFNWIHYQGAMTGRERVKYFKLASVQLMPGIVGLGILDSFALETPIITTNHSQHSPEIEYLENNINGIITKNTLEDYSETVTDTLKTNKYLNLVEGCIHSAKEYTIERMVENFKTGIISCLNAK